MAAIVPGASTSEFHLAKWATVGGAVVTGTGLVLESLAQAGIGQAWVGIALAVIGMASKIITALNYGAQRVDVKTAAGQD